MSAPGIPRRYRMGATGLGVSVATRPRRLPANPAPGSAHQWSIAAIWRVSAEAARAQATGAGDAEPVLLDTENLIALDGPGCWVCEQPWTPSTAAEPCPGDPATVANL